MNSLFAGCGFFKTVLGRCRDVAFLLLPALCLTSCFTGVEGTKRIELSRSDRKAVLPSAERLFSDSVSAQPLSEWLTGKEFLATDARLSVLLSPHDRDRHLTPDSLPGKIMRYKGMSSRLLPDGTDGAVLEFEIDGARYDYALSRPMAQALSSVRGDNLPMMIDLGLVGSMDSLLSGRTLWTRSQLWYSSDSLRTQGKKFIPVKVKRVEAGNSVFPLKVFFSASESGMTSGSGESFYFMNCGQSGHDSRSFETLFFLSDPRRRYSGIDPEVWELICVGKVRVGMTKEECRLSLGSPDDVAEGRDWSSTRDIWKYFGGRYLIFSDGVLSDFRL